MSDFTMNMNPTTDAEYLAVINQMTAEINRRHEEMVVMQKEIEASQARTEIIRADIQAALAELRNTRC